MLVLTFTAGCPRASSCGGVCSTCSRSHRLFALVLAFRSWWKQSNFFLGHLSNFLQEDFLQSLSHEDDVICGLRTCVHTHTHVNSQN